MYSDINVKSRVLRNGLSSIYFKLQGDYRKGDPILPYFQQRYQRYINEVDVQRSVFVKLLHLKIRRIRLF